MIPEWIKHLKKGDEILCVFGFSGKALYVTIMEDVSWPNDKKVGYWVAYSNEAQLEHLAPVWILEFEKYSNSPERDHWVAYQVIHNGILHSELQSNHSGN